ncbi:hypothetical protein [Stutzerimonas xanthomarina]|uniref:hypothetical protein n=1 Tax=Stutzerimonas xanthomarina TaxID=271420 RepID=UPI003AA8E16C
MLNDQGAFSALKRTPGLWELLRDSDHFEGGDYPGFAVLSQPLQATANYCGMHWLSPVAIHGAYSANQTELLTQIRHYFELLTSWKED